MTYLSVCKFLSLPIKCLYGVQCFLCSQPRYQSLGLLPVPLPHQLARLLPGELLVDLLGPFSCASEGQLCASGLCDANSQHANACSHELDCFVRPVVFQHKLTDMTAS